MANGREQASSLKSALRRVLRVLNAVRVAPLLLPYRLSSQRPTIDLDVRRWLAETHYQGTSQTQGLLWLLARLPEFRSLFYYRIEHGNLPAEVLARLLKIIYRGCSTLSIACDDIGPGLFIQHGIGTFIYAKRIGANCWINQQVTIGYLDEQLMPVLGDHVFAFVGSKILGDITVGSHVMIGANAVVVKDVPDNCTVVGVPARIVKRDGVRVNEPL